jgi:hypothetical protein
MGSPTWRAWCGGVGVVGKRRIGREEQKDRREKERGEEEKKKERKKNRQRHNGHFIIRLGEGVLPNDSLKQLMVLTIPT